MFIEISGWLALVSFIALLAGSVCQLHRKAKAKILAEAKEAELRLRIAQAVDSRPLSSFSIDNCLDTAKEIAPDLGISSNKAHGMLNIELHRRGINRNSI